MSRVFVGMSGGLDSAVAAWMLREQGHEVTGITFTTFKDNEYRSCGGRGSANLAKKLCESMGMKHYTLGLSTLFDREIVRDFVESYREGFTPNPCVLCNRLVKFGALADYAFSLGAEFYATGHYIRLVRDGGRTFLRKGVDETKDQAYFLAMTPPEKLEKVRFPLGEMRKTEVRELAEKNNLPIPPKLRESQDVCFVPGDYREYLAAAGVAETPGDFVLDGKVVGRHRGIPFYSFGQRRGLNVAVGHRLFVRGFDAGTNRIFLGEIPVIKRFATSAPNVFDEGFGTDMVEYDVQAR
jgi:tRNA-specific 2-thiouridylase